MHAKLFALIAGATLGVILPAAHVDYQAAKKAWSLKSGAVEYRLRNQDGSVWLAYVGPGGGTDWPPAVGRYASLQPRYDITGLVDGQTLLPQDLRLASDEIRRPRPDCAELRLLFKHVRLPLEIEALYTAWGDTGVFTRQLTFINRGGRVLQMERAPGFHGAFRPAGTRSSTSTGCHGKSGSLRQRRLARGGVPSSTPLAAPQRAHRPGFR